MLTTNKLQTSNESLRMLFSAVESARSGVVITDARLQDNPIVYANPGFVQLTGYTVDEIVGRNCRFLQGKDQSQSEANVIRESLAAKKGCKVCLRNYKKDGSLFWNELIVSPVFSEAGELTHFVGIQNDITEVVQLRQQRDDFVSTLVHDLKNPLIASNRILAMINASQVTPEDQSLFLHKIQESTKSMLRMIANSLDYYRSEAGPLRPVNQPFNLCQLCRNVVAEFDVDSRQRSIAVTQSGPESLMVLGDESLIRRVLVNLLDNALKFTETNGKISLVIEQADQTGQAAVHVINTGAGLGEDDISCLFERFGQAQNGRQYTPGTGLGLFLCRQIISAHGGSIFCQSKVGVETKFTFTLPLFCVGS